MGGCQRDTGRAWDARVSVSAAAAAGAGAGGGDATTIAPSVTSATISLGTVLAPGRWRELCIPRADECVAWNMVVGIMPCACSKGRRGPGEATAWHGVCHARVHGIASGSACRDSDLPQVQLQAAAF